MDMRYKDYVCPVCYNTLDSCTCKNQPWRLIMIDKNMQEIIRTLNKKGYITTNCCESHYNRTISIYVQFLDVYEFPNLPDTFTLSRDKKSVGYRFTAKDRKTLEGYEKLKAEKIDIFKKWANDLPAR